MCIVTGIIRTFGLQRQTTDPMSDFFKKFKSIFVEEAPSAVPERAVPETPAVKRDVSPAVVPPAALAGGQVTDKFLEVLLGALEKGNQQGFDYLEFRQALKNLTKVVADEPTRFQSAFAMAQAMGVGVAGLADSAHKYLQLLEGEQAKFNEAHHQQRERLVGTRETEVKNIEAGVAQKAEQIRLLTQQIEEDRKKAEQLRHEIETSMAKIEATKSDFEATFQNVAGQIRHDLSQMEQYLKTQA